MKTEKPKVAICWYHQLGSLGSLESKDESLQGYSQRVREISYYWTRQLLWQTSIEEIFESDQIEELFEKAVESEARYILLVEDGQLIRSPHFIRDCLGHLARTGHIALAHLLAKANEYPSLHFQCFFADLDRVNLLSLMEKAKAGGSAQPYIRSQDNIHDDYTPHFIAPDLTSPANEALLKFPQTFESAFLSELLTIGPVSNFSPELREQKLHLYPENNPELFWRCLKGEEDYRSVELDPGQVFYLDCHQLAQTRDKIFVFNTEILSPPQKTPKPLTQFYGVAAGFRPYVLLEANGFSVKTKVTYFDYSKHSLMLKKYLVENWDGVDYHQICESFLKDAGLERHVFHDIGSSEAWKARFEEVIEQFGTLDDWLHFWERYRVLDHEYIEVNLFDTPEVLTDHIKLNAQGIDPETIWVWWSNCFYTEVGVVNYGGDILKEKFETFFSKLIEISPDIFGDGGNHDQLTWVARLKDMPFASMPL